MIDVEAANTTTFLEIIADNWKMTVIAAVAIVWIVFATIDSMVKSVSRERARREIAAYVAEGTMNASDAERLLKPGKKSCGT